LIENKIHILPDFIANQIAAGEVVQRPESVVKELVENALDSGATEIAVIIQDGGKQLISVIDNGCGMSDEDLLLSIKRHATSKIKTQEDLEKISTFGFRGEALASITSVAYLEIRTKLAENEHGSRLICEPNKEPVLEPFNQQFGTQIFVKNLFFNVPARKKFLKSKLTEVRHISDTLIRFALSNPEIRFTYYNEDLMIFDVKPTGVKERIAALLGSSSNEGYMLVEYENELMKISGYIGNPSLARPSTSGQYLFVNKRPIESRNLSFAIYSAFEQLLEKNHKPVYVINLEIDPEKIDVNIHPQKNEVKFENENYVYNTLRKAVGLTLERNNLTTNLSLQSKEINQPFVRIKNEHETDSYILVNQVTGEIIPENDIKLESNQKKDIFSGRPFARNNLNYKSSSGNFQRDFHPGNYSQMVQSNYTDSLNIESSPSEIGLHSFNSPKSDLEQIRSELPYSDFWQIHNKYIFVQTKSGIIIVDQHNAHERVIYEKTIDRLNNIYAKGQETLFPIEISMKISNISILEEIADEIKKLGYDFTINHPDKVILTSKPTDVPNGLEEKMLTDMLEDYVNTLKISNSSKRERIAATFSCKSAIKTGDKLTQERMKQLTIDLFNCRIPYVCPHGRPIILELPLLDLDKQFGRI
jgi:DNA mismatch repair protein MutL